MKRVSSIAVLGLLLSGFMGAACGGNGEESDGDGESGINSGVDGDTEVGDLTVAEAASLCEGVGDYMKKQLPPAELCQIVGMEAYGEELESSESFDDAESACEAATSSCVDDPPDEIYGGCDEVDGVPDDCTNTVDEMEACFEELIDAQAKAYKDLDFPACDGILEWYLENGDEGLDEAFDIDIDSLAACQDLDAGCRKIFEDGDETSMGAGGAN